VVSAAAVILKPGTRIIGIDDSKKLDAASREELAKEIKAKAASRNVAFVEVEEIDSINIYWVGMRAMQRAVHAWALQQAFLEHLSKVWRHPDRGIWESRKPERHFVFRKIMAWVAFDRGAKIAREFRLQGPLERWDTIAKEMMSASMVSTRS
jgi:GH15 family glucan-1,4-alpha-glucosidase